MYRVTVNLHAFIARRGYKPTIRVGHTDLRTIIACSSPHQRCFHTAAQANYASASIDMPKIMVAYDEAFVKSWFGMCGRSPVVQMPLNVMYAHHNGFENSVLTQLLERGSVFEV